MPQSFDIEGIFRYAIEKGGGPETMTTLMNIRRELNAEQAKKAFDEALSGFQSKCPVIVKGKGVPDRSGSVAYKFAPIEQIENVIRPVELEYGFSHTFDQDVSSVPGWVIASCIVTHVGGYSRPATVKLPLGTKTGIMSETQVYASALTFANRRALANAYGLVLVGEDFDGGLRPKPAGPQAAPKSAPAPATEPSGPPPFAPVPAPKKPTGGEKVTLTAIWNLCKLHDGTLVEKKNWDAINSWMKGNPNILQPAEFLPALPAERLTEILKATDKHLNP